METRKIGSLEVTIVGLGGNNFGGRLDSKGTRAVVDAALEAGINFIDTADIYGGTKSEEFQGHALEGRREKVVLATKFGMKVDEKRHGAKPAYVRRACEDSLRRLRTDWIDLYQLHQPDPETPIGDTLAALDELVCAGKGTRDRLLELFGRTDPRGGCRGADRRSSVRQRAERIQPSPSRAGTRGSARMRAPRSGVHPLLSAGERSPDR